MNNIAIGCMGDNEVCVPVSSYTVKTEKKKTEGDKIRKMKDEKLAEIITSKACKFCAYQYKSCAIYKCSDGVLKFLQSEAE